MSPSPSGGESPLQGWGLGGSGGAGHGCFSLPIGWNQAGMAAGM